MTNKFKELGLFPNVRKHIDYIIETFTQSY